jgi:hypothetical protein
VCALLLSSWHFQNLVLMPVPRSVDSTPTMLPLDGSHASGIMGSLFESPQLLPQPYPSCCSSRLPCVRCASALVSDEDEKEDILTIPERASAAAASLRVRLRVKHRRWGGKGRKHWAQVKNLSITVTRNQSDDYAASSRSACPSLQCCKFGRYIVNSR